MDEYIKFKTPVPGHVDMSGYDQWYRQNTFGSRVSKHGNVKVISYRNIYGPEFECCWLFGSVVAFVPARFVTLFAIAEPEDE